MNAFAQPPGLSAGRPMPCNGSHRLPPLSRAFTFAATGHLSPLPSFRTTGPVLPCFAHPHP